MQVILSAEEADRFLAVTEILAGAFDRAGLRLSKGRWAMMQAGKVRVMDREQGRQEEFASLSVFRGVYGKAD